MNRSHLPLMALRAFEATARHLSVTRAATELCVTPGAISQQVKSLEEVLGVTLVQRHGRALALTDAGQVLRPQLTQALDLIGLALDSVARSARSHPLQLVLLPTLAEKWLMPRLARFQGEHPTLDIQVMTSFREVDFATEGVDMASWMGHALPAGMAGVRIFDDAFMPVCSPRLAKGKRPLRTPRDLARCTLLHSVRRADDWHRWLQLVGEADLKPAQNLSFGNAALALHAAIDGLGVAITQQEYARAHIAAGQLIAPFAEVARGRAGYHLVWPAARAESAAFRAFRDWIVDEAGARPA